MQTLGMHTGQDLHWVCPGALGHPVEAGARCYIFGVRYNLGELRALDDLVVLP